MRKLGMLWGVIIMMVMSLFYGIGSANAANYYDQQWTNDMNQTSYWAPWDCTKYDGHGGWIPAQYDAAIIKAGQMVRVYPDLTSTGGFQASAPDNKDISWVMKCKHPVVDTTTTTSTTTTTTTSTTTSTTSVPSSSTTTSTSDVPTTTVVETTSTSTPTTTSPPETTATSTPDSTPDTVPVTTPPDSPEGPATTSPTPDTPPTSATPPSTPTSPSLPATGNETTWMVLLASVLLLGGGGATWIARKN